MRTPLSSSGTYNNFRFNFVDLTFVRLFLKRVLLFAEERGKKGKKIGKPAKAERIREIAVGGRGGGGRRKIGPDPHVI